MVERRTLLPGRAAVRVLTTASTALLGAALLLTAATTGSADAASGTQHRTVERPRGLRAPAPPASQRIATKANARPGSTVTMVSESGDWVGQGTSRFWRTTRDTITTGGGGGQLGVSVSGGSGDFTLEFAAPDGKKLTPGAYTHAVRYPFQSAGQAGLDVSGDGRGCNEVSGRFWVLDINPSRSRVWVVYEEHCEGGRPAVFGEVRVGEPADGTTLVSPTRVRWPDDYPDVPLRPVPVHVVNRGTTTLTVDDATVVAGATDFSVLSNTCSAVAAGDDCTVYVGFTPSIRGPRLGELRLATSAGTRWIPLAGYGTPGRTFWEMHSQPGDYIGAGQDYLYTPETGAQIGAGGSETYADAAVDSGGDWWYADFEAAPGQLLLPGTTFDNATRYPFNAGAGLSIYGNGRGCNELTGSFTVESSHFTDSGALTSFLIDFTQYCDADTAPLTGTIAWNAPDPSAPPRDTAPPAVVHDVVLHTTRRGRVTVTWQNPQDQDWVDTALRIRPGRDAPRTPDRGREVYTGRGTSARAHVSTSHRRYTLAIFTRDESGNVTRVTKAVRLP